MQYSGAPAPDVQAEITELRGQIIQLRNQQRERPSDPELSL